MGKSGWDRRNPPAVFPWSSGHPLPIPTLWALSPSGEIISRIPIIARNETSIPFLLEPTVITVNYQLIESGAGKQLIFMRFRNPVAGIWKVRVYNTQYFTGGIPYVAALRGTGIG